MAAAIPLLLFAFLGSVIQIGWMFGKKEGRRWRTAIGGLLLFGLVTCLAIVFMAGIFRSVGAIAFQAAWLITIAMYLAPVSESAWKALR